MDFEKAIQNARDKLNRKAIKNEMQVRMVVVLPILRQLGWQDTDPNEVYGEYPVKSRFVDYALIIDNHPVVFIETKRVGGLDLKAESQLFTYANNQGIPILILTDGQIWDFYLSMAPGQPADRCFARIDLTKDDLVVIVDTLEKFLRKPAIASEAARHEADKQLKTIKRRQQARDKIPQTWQSLVSQPNSTLIDLVINKIKADFNLEVEAGDVREFFEHQARVNTTRQPQPRISPARKPLPELSLSNPLTQRRKKGVRKRLVKATLYGQDINKTKVSDTYVEILARLQKIDPSFLNRLSNHPKASSKSRKLVARNKNQLFPQSPHLADSCSRQISDGWWANTNNSSSKCEQIIKDIVCEVAGLRFGSDLILEWQEDKA